MSAKFSACGRYRYLLERRWAEGRLATFIMLNPSTADAEKDDPTIRRCIGFAKSWGLGGIRVVNLYALRSTNPAGLWAVDDPIGPANNAWLVDAADDAYDHGAPLVAAWGANAKLDRVRDVQQMLRRYQLKALGVTKAGQPRHPLYLPGSSVLSEWEIK